MIYFSHDYPNDTTYEFEQDPDGRGQITMTFTSEDPDYGTETLVYGGNGTEHELRDELLHDLTECLDLQEEGHCGMMPDNLKYYDEEFTRTTLIACENALHWIQEGETNADQG